MQSLKFGSGNLSDLPSYRAANDAGESANRPRRKRRQAASISKPSAPKIEIRCLGYFSVRRGPSAAPRVIRAQSRPAELLYLLIVAGSDGIDKNQAETALWPDAKPALANSTLDTTLYRLRRLLGAPRALRVAAGVIRLDDDYVSVDVWNFNREADALYARLQMPAEESDAGEIAVRCERLIDLYHGPFLVAAGATAWIAQARDRLRAKFFRVLKQACAYWQGLGRWDRAAQLYGRALEIDNLSEELYRELMYCHFVRGQFAETVIVYRRCRELLSTVLGVNPSAETEALYQQALGAQP
jgi:LuxR family transcriptional regulator, maltose regulon positive regulatory protein